MARSPRFELASKVLPARFAQFFDDLRILRR
jgi:hypothetical protein